MFHPNLERIAVVGILLLIGSCGGGSNSGESSAPGSTPSSPIAFIGFAGPPQSSTGGASFYLPPVSALPDVGSPTLTLSAPYSSFVNELTVDTAGTPTSWDHGGFINFNTTSSSAGFWEAIDFRRGSTPIATISPTSEYPCPYTPTHPSQAPMILLRTLTDARTALIIYQTPGNDGTCGTSDDVFEAINFNGTSADAPVILPSHRFPVGVVYSTTGNLAGLALLENQQLVWVTDFSTFSNGTVLASNVINALQLGQTGASGNANTIGDSGQMFLDVFDPSLNQTLHRIDTAGTYSPSLYNFKATTVYQADPVSLSNFTFEDDSNLYVLENYETGPSSSNPQYVLNVLSLPLDGSSSAILIHAYSGYSGVQPNGLTQHNIVAQLATKQAGGAITVQTALISKVADASTRPPTTSGTPTYVTSSTLYFNDFQIQVADENGTAIAQYSGFLFGSLLVPASTMRQTPIVTTGHVLLASTGSGETDYSLYDLVGAQAPVALTTAAGSPITFSPSGAGDGPGLNFLSVVPIDTGFITHQPSDQTQAAEEQDILEIDLTHHVAAQLTNTPESEYPFN